MFSKEYMSSPLILVEFLERGHEICHFWAILQSGTSTQIGMVPVPICRGKMVPVPIKVIPIPLTRIGLVPVPIQVVPVPLLPVTLIFGILTLLSSKSHIEGIGTLIND